MQGFRRRSEVPAVLEWIDRNASQMEIEVVSLDIATGRVLAGDVIAPIDVPGFDRAAMDGYALRGEDTSGANEYSPLSFPLAGQVLPGERFGARVAAGEAVKIMTGAPVPDGLDAVVPAEFASESAGRIEITRPVAPSQHVAHRGEDVAAGTAVLKARRRLRAQDAGLIASLGLSQVPVVRQPRVRIVVTGNEVVTPGTSKSLYQIYDANSYMLRGLIGRDGGILEAVQRRRDDPAAIREAHDHAASHVDIGALQLACSRQAALPMSPRSSPPPASTIPRRRVNR